MKVVLLLFDSLNRHFLSPYGKTEAVTPNFDKLAEQTVTFENHYAASLPCMPARRDLHTGRCNFLHRSWGPLEPFDESVFEMLKQNGISSHLITDHQHYWEDGGATYHNRYSSYEFVRGQEGDLWKTDLNVKKLPPHLGRAELQDESNRQFYQQQAAYPLDNVFQLAEEFLETNGQASDWLLQIECFDPHEPFDVEEHYSDLPEEDRLSLRFDWPEYRKVTESPAAVAHLRSQYATLLKKCDEKLGTLLRIFDEQQLWEDTALIVTTDHGFLLGEHDSWAKAVHPFYNEIAHIPLFYWDPRTKEKNTAATGLTQTIDLAPTLLDLFGMARGKWMTGQPLQRAVAKPSHRYGLFGIHGGQLNLTDGRYVYMRGPATKQAMCWDYTLMPTHMRSFFSIEELRQASWVQGFAFMQGLHAMKIPAAEIDFTNGNFSSETYTAIYDLKRDPQQLLPFREAKLEVQLTKKMRELLIELEAPAELFERFQLN